MWLFLLGVACSPPKSPPAGDTSATAVDTAPPRESGDACGEWISPADGGCDDSNLMVGPYCEELCNGIDDDCDEQIDEGVEGVYYPDLDGDGFGAVEAAVYACDPPDGTVHEAGDCDDADPTRSPAVAEACNGIDDDCDGEIDDGCA